jgi:hypothetical protein
MKPLFPSWTNSAFAGALGVGAIAGAGAIATPLVWARTPYANGKYDVIDQPIAFDHRHHVRDDGIGCLYCHGDAARGPYAGVPSTALCMGCHAQVWNDSARLAPLRQSFFENKPVVWQRVTNMPAFVYFDHSAHVKHGVGCVTCHGRVDRMAQVYQTETMTMSFCLDCHRDPDPSLRPLDRVADMDWEPLDKRKTGAEVRRALHVDPPTDCSTCHR